MRRTTRLRELIAAPEILVMPGVHDALGARLAEAAGFSAITAGGYGATATLLGRPDSSQLVADRVVGNVFAPVRCDGVAAPRRCRHRLRQRDQRRARRQTVRKGRRRRPLHRGPGLSEALRPHGRQGGRLARGMAREDQGGARRARRSGLRHHGAHRRAGRQRHRRRDRARATRTRGRRRPAVRRGADRTPRRCAGSAPKSPVRASRTTSRPACRRCCPRRNCKRSATRSSCSRSPRPTPSPTRCANCSRRSGAPASTAEFLQRLLDFGEFNELVGLSAQRRARGGMAARRRGARGHRRPDAASIALQPRGDQRHARSFRPWLPLALPSARRPLSPSRSSCASRTRCRPRIICRSCCRTSPRTSRREPTDRSTCSFSAPSSSRRPARISRRSRAATSRPPSASTSSGERRFPR